MASGLTLQENKAFHIFNCQVYWRSFQTLDLKVSYMLSRWSLNGHH